MPQPQSQSAWPPPRSGNAHWITDNNTIWIFGGEAQVECTKGVHFGYKFYLLTLFVQ